MNENVKLLPCPFCGRADPHDFCRGMNAAAKKIVCPGCGAQAHTVESWNRRSPAQPPSTNDEPTRTVLTVDAVMTVVATELGGAFTNPHALYAHQAEDVIRQIRHKLDALAAQLAGKDKQLDAGGK